MSRRLGDTKSDHHFIEEWRIRELYSRSAQIITGVKRQFVYARQERVIGKRFDGTAIGVRGRRFKVVPFSIRTGMQFDDESLGGCATRHVKDVCGERRHFYLRSLKPRQPYGGRGSV
jgi:hypothetical protein